MILGKPIIFEITPSLEWITDAKVSDIPYIIKLLPMIDVELIDVNKHTLLMLLLKYQIGSEWGPVAKLLISKETAGMANNLNCCALIYLLAKPRGPEWVPAAKWLISKKPARMCGNYCPQPCSFLLEHQTNTCWAPIAKLLIGKVLGNHRSFGLMHLLSKPRGPEWVPIAKWLIRHTVNMGSPLKCLLDHQTNTCWAPIAKMLITKETAMVPGFVNVGWLMENPRDSLMIHLLNKPRGPEWGPVAKMLIEYGKVDNIRIYAQTALLRLLEHQTDAVWIEVAKLLITTHTAASFRHIPPERRSAIRGPIWDAVSNMLT